MHLLILLALCSALALDIQAATFGADRAPPAPEFNESSPTQWLNAAPLQLANLRGRVVLVEFWTFDCWNCYRSLPWLNALEARHRAAGLQVIGVHTPEFAHEKVPANVRAKIDEHAIKYPVVLDNDLRIWRAFGNRYWPAFYVIDKRGRIRGYFAGETHTDDPQAHEIETLLVALLAEAP